MNCPSRTDEPEGTGFNQNPNALAADLTTREDLNGRANSRLLRRIASTDVENVVEDEGGLDEPGGSSQRNAGEKKGGAMLERTVTRGASHVGRPREILEVSESAGGVGRSDSPVVKYSKSALEAVKKFGKFVGPGFMVRILPLFIKSHLRCNRFPWHTLTLATIPPMLQPVHHTNTDYSSSF
jgi:metal iron transporter